MLGSLEPTIKNGVKRSAEVYALLIKLFASNSTLRSPLRGEWPSGLNSFYRLTEVKLGRMRSNS